MPLLPLLRFWKHIVAVLVIASLLIIAYRWAYERGQAEREAHYGPILAAIKEERDAAEARVAALQTASANITEEAKKANAEALKLAQNRAAAAERDYARILRERSRGDRCEMPAVPGTSGGIAATAAERERDDRFARDLAAVAHACETDAATLSGLQEWVRRQAALEGNPAPP